MEISVDRSNHVLRNRNIRLGKGDEQIHFLAGEEIGGERGGGTKKNTIDKGAYFCLVDLAFPSV